MTAGRRTFYAKINFGISANFFCKKRGECGDLSVKMDFRGNDGGEAHNAKIKFEIPAKRPEKSTFANAEKLNAVIPAKAGRQIPVRSATEGPKKGDRRIILFWLFVITSEAYTHLSLSHRITICVRRQKISQRKIAKELGVSVSTISREIKRCGGNTIPKSLIIAPKCDDDAPPNARANFPMPYCATSRFG